MNYDVQDSTLATGRDMTELQANVKHAMDEGWLPAGQAMVHGNQLVQAMAKYEAGPAV